MAIPLLDPIDIDGMVITADALLTQRQFARYLIEDKQAHYHFTVKGNQATLLDDLKTLFQNRKQPDAETTDSGHGRIETRRIWVSDCINDYVNFPYVGQAFAIERETINKKTGKLSREMAYGITSQKAYEANAQTILTTNRNHWCIEKTVATTFLTGRSMKIFAEFEVCMVRKTLVVCDALLLE